MNDVDEQRKRAAFIQHLYDQDGRGDPSHPFHAKFTGLWLEYKDRLAESTRDAWWTKNNPTETPGK